MTQGEKLVLAVTLYDEEQLDGNSIRKALSRWRQQQK